MSFRPKPRPVMDALTKAALKKCRGFACQNMTANARQVCLSCLKTGKYDQWWDAVAGMAMIPIKTVAEARRLRVAAL